MTAASTRPTTDERCGRCAKPLSQSFGGALIADDGLATCFTGRLPSVEDIGRRHLPAAPGDEGPYDLAALVARAEAVLDELTAPGSERRDLLMARLMVPVVEHLRAEAGDDTAGAAS